MTPTLLASRIRKVTVFRQGAVIARDASRPDAGWPREVVVDHLPLALEDGTVRVRFAEASGRKVGVEATDVRVELTVPPLGDPIEPPSEAQLRKAQQQVERLEQEIERLDEESASFERVEFRLPERLEREAPRAVSAGVWRAVAAWLERAEGTRADQRSSLRKRLFEAFEELQRLQRRVAEARAERGVDEDAVCKRVLITLRDDAGDQPEAMELEYRVPGACWRPAYVLRVAPGGASAELALRALVCQRTGEPWERVTLAASTADLLREVSLPELRSVRIGRRQPPELTRAWREPPSGAEDLFENLDAAMSERPSPPPPTQARPIPRAPQPAGEAWKEVAKTEDDLDACMDEAFEAAALECEEIGDQMRSERRVSAQSFESPPPGVQMAAPAPHRAKKKSALLGGLAELASEAFGGEQPAVRAGAVAGGAPPAPLSEPAEPVARRLTVRESLFDYDRLRLGGWDRGATERGQLRRLALGDLLTDITPNQVSRVDALLRQSRRDALSLDSFPPAARSIEVSSGSYDHVYRATGPVDVPGDGKVHNVPLSAHEEDVQLTLVVVPRHSDQAVRVATLRNPLATPLLQGPADIYLGGEFLVTSKIDTVPAGADLEVGLGVEEALKVARNTHFKEETEGLLRGSLALQHEVTIEVASRLTVPVDVEVRERLPIKGDDDKDIEIEPGTVEPEWSDWEQTAEQPLRGGKRWRITLDAGESRELRYAYDVQIDSKNELVGGNRRERG